jgi:predicted esterase
MFHLENFNQTIINITQEVEGSINMKCIAEDFSYKGISYTLYTSSVSKNKPLIFFVHGFERDKYTGVGEMPLQLSRKGFNVIAIDAFLHGERSTDSFNALSTDEKEKHIFKIIMKTTKDLKILMKLFKSIPEFDTSTFGIAGISMGAMIAFYATTKIKEFSVVVPMIGTPAFYDAATSMESIPFTQRIALFGLNLVDPVRNYKKFIDRKLLIINGEKDKVLPLDGSKKLHDLLKDTNAIVEFNTYDSDHWITDQMRYDMYAWFEKYL